MLLIYLAKRVDFHHLVQKYEEPIIFYSGLKFCKAAKFGIFKSAGERFSLIFNEESEALDKNCLEQSSLKES